MNRLVLLGTKGGPAIRAGGAMPTASLLELDGLRVVVDCGLGVTRGLVEAGVDLRTLDAVFVTHLHSDHLLELGPLLHTAWTTGLARPIRVFGPDGIADYWRHFLDSMAFDNDIRVRDEGRTPLEALVEVTTYGAGEVACAGLAVRALQVPHPPVEQAYALRFDGSRSVTFSGDTAHFPPLAEFARGSDVLVHEAMLPAAIENLVRRTGAGDRLRAHLHASHTTADDAARIAAAAGPGHLVFNHLVPGDDPGFTQADWIAKVTPHWPGRFTLGRDGMEIML